VPVALPVPIPVVPGVVLDAPGEATPGEATPGDAVLPPALPAAPAAPPPPAPPPAANAQLEDTARAAAITIVVIFMTSVSLSWSKENDCRRVMFLIGPLKLSGCAIGQSESLMRSLASGGKDVLAPE
jgi:hypothetical protein